MRITFQPVRQTQSGFALLVVMAFIVASLIVFFSVMFWASSNANVTQRNIIFNQSEAAAEAADEFVISKMLSDFTSLCLNASNNYTTLIPPTNDWPVLYQFSATNGAPNSSVFVNIGPTNWGNLPAQFTGLSGNGQNCIIACTATPLSQSVSVPATVAETVWFGTIPMCQYAVFYNVVLEINPGAAFNITGKVHCNTNMYCTGDSSSAPLTFLSSVDCSGVYTNNPSPADPQNYGKRTGNVVMPANYPMDHTDTLNLPLGNSATNYTYAAIESMLQLPPATYASGLQAAYTTNGQIYFANRADLLITNDVATGTNITVFYQNPNNSPNYLVPVARDATNIYITHTNTTITTNGSGANKTYTTNFSYLYFTNIFFSYVTNVVFYDYRESAPVKALQLDVGMLGAWLGNTNGTGGHQYELKSASGTSTDVGHVINSVYIFNSLNPVAGSTLPAVRVVNCALLPTNTVPNPNNPYRLSGLGIATAQPIYVRGDFNVSTDGVHFAYTLGSTTNGCSLPACLIGDAITLLSSNFVDNATGGTENPAPTQNAITLNAACFEGIVPSNTNYYSGGLENFLRLLENWSGDTVNYNGSIVVMFPSTYATNHWGGSYYGAPTRAWGFDTTFAQPAGQPPLFPSLKGDARSAWTYR
jgi:hypothetical protein